MGILRIVLCVLLAVAAGACTRVGMIRTAVERSAPGDCEGANGTGAKEKCRLSTIEHHVVQGDRTEYLLGVVEFDDQGWFQHARQMNLLMSQLEAEAREQDLIVAVFVHGWKHGAEYCDTNLTCYREVLRYIARAEKEYHTQLGLPPNVRPRRVFGVYVAWRGLSVDGPDLLRSTSFWDRKSVAAQVAQGSVRELFARLRQFQQNHNDSDWVRKHLGDARAEPPGRNRLFILGHSFGGLIAYTSVAQALMNNAVSPRGLAESESRVEGFGDLVVLVNPAFEGSRFEPLHRIGQTRRYPPDQDPVFIALTSTDDQATSRFFPLGRWFSTRLETYTTSPKDPPSEPGLDERHDAEDQQEASMKTVGHVPRYVTHVLEPTGGARLVTAGELAGDCACPHRDAMREVSRVDWKAEKQRSEEFDRTQKMGGQRQKGWRRVYEGGLTLRQYLRAGDREEGAELNPNSPFWVVRTDSPIVRGHNDFWTPHVFTFLRQVYDDQLRSLERRRSAPRRPGQ